MIKIHLKNSKDEIVEYYYKGERLVRLTAASENMAVLAWKEHAFQEGDYFEVELENEGNYFVVKMDETLPPTFMYIPSSTWRFPILFTEEKRLASPEYLFMAKNHSVYVRKAYDFEISQYKNLAYNPHDQEQVSGAYPHASANVETRGESVFFAKNTIDGGYASLGHGKYPFQSWGINQQADAALTIDFGRKVKINRCHLVLRADFPHDSYWTQATLVFDDGSESLSLVKSSEVQAFNLTEHVTQKVVLKDLIKHEDESPFPALIQFECFGWEG
ncbi:hypothetical protein U1303_08865 [Enterococcus cecorum]|uniref:hypothetical protein n=1 Tax=Enterococcus cecorum TaxID=44008 RepID=UPI002AC9FE55|nr:hypothetical protein [Enterococcus cecorum]MDZ5502908.1 hypothetical protein [Enterococcus cecorum]MDZ5509896.1 hypothetical protein [Enterococcus cecorum]MDZ5556847.1 hypothetical protein [Enterococcus cecorum]MDZ5558765.1 hypothetical protein [Enterococcus cecorum]MDZ5591822.1 hypothetical protein [Enterococcus cecorum]